jgi:hypothetical protein
LDNKRPGFGKDLSTNKTIYKLTYNILQALNNESDVSAKAFDCADHGITISKQDYGINGDASQWLATYLAKRRQSVVMKYKNSVIMFILTGVKFNMEILKVSSLISCTLMSYHPI